MAATGLRQMDLGIADVHTPGAMGGAAGTLEDPAAVVRRVSEDRLGVASRDMSISAANRKSLPKTQFALPSLRKYPIDTAGRTRNAAARLEQMKKRGLVSESQYKEAKGRIARAAKKFGIESEYNATDYEGPPRDSRKRLPSTIHVRADLAPGGALHVRHMSDRVFYDGEGVLLSDIGAIEDEAPVWIQIAKQGAFAGHPAGPFKLDTKTFEEIVTNFKATTNQHIPWDFEHASEQDPTSGSIATNGAPAQGWITDLKIENGNLYGLTRWGELARQYVREGKYRYCSPAIRFGSKDRVTGKPIGARLTSVALTNEPFLDALAPLAAKDGAGPDAATVALRGGLNRPVHSPHEYMPQIKAALKLGPLATHAECADTLNRLRECCMSVGVDGMHDGESMTDYTRPMRDLVGAAPGMTAEELFDIVEDLIGHAIDQHVAEMHPGGASMNDDPSGEDLTMADRELTQLLADEKTRNTTLADKITTAERVARDLESKLTLADKRATDAESTVKSAGAALKLKDGESLADGIARVVGENKTLLDEKAKREEADIDADVQEAIDTYREKMGLTDAHKPSLRVLAKADRAAFVAMYPPVAPAHRTLLREVTPPNPRPGARERTVVPTYTETVRKLMKDKGMSLSDAQIEASKLVQAAAKRAQAELDEASGGTEDGK